MPNTDRPRFLNPDEISQAVKMTYDCDPNKFQRCKNTAINKVEGAIAKGFIAEGIVYFLIAFALRDLGFTEETTESFTQRFFEQRQRHMPNDLKPPRLNPGEPEGNQ